MVSMQTQSRTPRRKTRFRKLSEKLSIVDSKNTSFSNEEKTVTDERHDIVSQRTRPEGDLILFNCQNGKCITPNEKSCQIDNDLLTGHMLPLIATSDNCIAQFEGRKRKVELQFQLKFKRLPKGELFLGCELRNPLNTGVCQRALLKAVLGGVQRKNPDLLYSFDGSDTHYSHSSRRLSNSSNNNAPRRPSMAMPFESSINTLVVTKEGCVLPILGEPLEVQSVCKGKVVFNTDDTYTFAIWTANVDLDQWKCSAAPIHSFTLNVLTGDQPFTLNLFSMNPVDCNVEKYVELEFSHKQFTVNSAREAFEYSNIRNVTNDSLLDLADESFDSGDIREDFDERIKAYDIGQGCMCWSAWD